MEKDIVGRTIIARGHDSTNFECFAILNDEYASRLDLQEPGVVYEILEGRENDKCYGIVESSRKSSEDRSPLDEHLSMEPAPEIEPITSAVMKLSIFRESGIAAPVGRHPIKLADERGVHLAFNIPDPSKEDVIPVGMYALLSGLPPQKCIVYLPVSYVLGPEAAHINIGGQSGYAKTAWALLCCYAILSNEKIARETCVIAFNVKADDLLWVDMENDELSDDDMELYRLMSIEPKAFEDVKIFAPEHPKRNMPNSLRPDAEMFSWEWEDVKEQIHFAVSPEDWDDRLEALLTDLCGIEDVKEFQDVIDELDAMIRDSKGGWVRSRSGGVHHVATALKAKRIISGIRKRFKGLIEGETAQPLPISDLLVGGRFSVIDVERLSPAAQRLVFSKVYADTFWELEKGTAKVKRIIYLIDELNKFAPKGVRQGPIAGIRAIVDEIASRGRSIGAILIGIEQYPSRISDDTTGNVATMVYCKMKASELNAQLYSGLSRELKLLIQRLPKGFAIVDHDTFNRPILIRFPRPPCAQKRPLEYNIMVHLAEHMAPEDRVYLRDLVRRLRYASNEKVYEVLDMYVKQGILPKEVVSDYTKQRGEVYERAKRSKP